LGPAPITAARFFAVSANLGYCKGDAEKTVRQQ
jgi:hypothetical protein